MHFLISKLEAAGLIQFRYCIIVLGLVVTIGFFSCLWNIRSSEQLLARSGRLRRYPESNDPVQGAAGNSWLVAALSAVAWADPYAILLLHV
jgi:hypothetical protein